MLPGNGLGGAELDTAEVLGGNPDVLYTTTHSVNGNGIHTADSVSNPESFDLTAAFHTYGVDWEPNLITWYLDGQVIATQVPPPGFNTPMYLLLNLAIGGFGGPPSATTFPADMQIESLQAYATANTIHASGTGLIATGSIAGTVTGSAGLLAGVAVGLVDTAGDLLATTTTDSNGYFIFTTLSAATYKVLYEAPAGTLPQAGSTADKITGLTAALTLTDGQALVLNPEALVTGTAASVAGTVLKSPDGISAGVAVSGETVKLMSGNTVVGTTISRQDGTFLFTNLAAGTYTVDYTVQSGESFETGGPANVKTGLSASVAVTAGNTTTMPVETVMPTPGAVSGFVLYNATGAQGITGVALAGATVTLLDQYGNPFATAVTGSDGQYLFSTVPAGQYRVQFYASPGYAFLNGSAADPVTGISNAGVFVTNANRTVASTETLTASSSIATLNGTVQFSDGTDPATALGGVTVTLDTNAGFAVATAVTDSTGAYSFIDLGPGNYEVAFSVPTGDAFTIASPANFVSGTTPVIALAAQQTYQVAPEILIANAASAITGSVLQAPVYTTATGTGVALASETVSLIGSNGLVAATTVSAADGSFGFSGLVGSNYTISYVLPATDSFQAGGPASVTTGKTAVLALQAGNTISLAAETLVPLPASMTGSVTYNGAAVNYVAIAVINATTGAVVETGATNYTGNYTLGGLIAGTYEIRYTAPKGLALQSGPADPITGLTGAITVGAGAAVTLAAETLMVAPASASGTVTTASGLGVAGMTIAALNASTGAVVATTTTTANGAFLITGLPAGSYQLRYTALAGTTLQSGPANVTTGLTATIALAIGQAFVETHETVGLTAPATLSGSVLGSFNGVSSGLSGVAVTLSGSAGTITATTTSTGSFTFKNVPAGTYTVTYPVPTGDALQAGGPANTTTAQAAVTLSTGQSLTLAAETLVVPPATVIGAVLYDGVGPAVAEAGVTVSLLNAAGTTLATTKTTGTGAFQFSGLAAGSYQVSYSAPNGQQVSVAPAAFTLTTGQTTTLPTETLVPVPGVIGGLVLLADAGQATVADPGVSVSLLGTGGAVVATTTTDGNGVFQFAGLAAATYTVSYALPAGQALQSGPAGATGVTAPISLTATQTDILATETLVVATANLSGAVMLAGTALAGVTIALLNAAGTTLATTKTNGTGSFKFSQLPSGSYTLDYTAPSGDALQAGGPANTTTGLTGAYVLTDGQALTAPPQSLLVLNPAVTGTVLHVGSGDLGTGQGAVTVALLNAAGTTLRTTLTTGPGAFSFLNVATGTYALKYILPTGEAFQAGGPANATTGITAPFTYTSGQALSLAAEDLTSTSTIFVLTGPGATAVRGDGNYTITGNGSSGSLQLGNGAQSVTLTGFSDAVKTGNGNQTITLAGTANTVTVGSGTQVINAGNGYDTVTLGATPAGTTSTVQMTGPGDKLTATGAGNVSVSGPTGSATIILGDGNQSVTLLGSSNTVTVGAGVSTIVAGQNGNVIHAGAGGDTISINGQGNLLDAAAGMNFYNATSTSRLATFMLNGSGQGLTTIAGFNTSDTLDLARTVAGLGVLTNFSNLGQFVTSSISSGSTTLFVDPTGGSGGTPYALATLSNVSTSVAQLITGHNFSLI